MNDKLFQAMRAIEDTIENTIYDSNKSCMHKARIIQDLMTAHNKISAIEYQLNTYIQNLPDYLDVGASNKIRKPF